MTVDEYIRRRPKLFRSILVLFCGYVFLTVWNLPLDPITINSVTAEQTVVRAGEQATFIFDIDRRRVCPGVVSSYWLDDNGKRVAEMPKRARITSTLGSVKVPLSVATPPFPGRFKFHLEMQVTCENGTFLTESPEIPIDVVAHE